MLTPIILHSGFNFLIQDPLVMEQLASMHRSNRDCSLIKMLTYPWSLTPSAFLINGTNEFTGINSQGTGQLLIGPPSMTIPRIDTSAPWRAPSQCRGKSILTLFSVWGLPRSASAKSTRKNPLCFSCRGISSNWRRRIKWWRAENKWILN